MSYKQKKSSSWRTETNQDKKKKRLTKEPVQFFRKFQSIRYLFAGLLKMFVPLYSNIGIKAHADS